MKTERLFLEFSCRKLAQLAERIGTCLDRLSEDQIWSRSAENDNAVGNLVLHLCGNVRQWVGFGVAAKPDIRAREQEFAARSGGNGPELKAMLSSAVEEALDVLRALPESRLTEPTRIQSYDLTVLEAVYHVVEHFAGHAGQVIFATKLHTGEDLGFYRHLSGPDPAGAGRKASP